MITIPEPSGSIFTAVAAAEADFSTAMVGGKFYEFCSSTNCYIKQGKALLVTCSTKANLVDGEQLTVTLDGVATVFEFDKTGDGVSSGAIAMDVSGVGVVTAANVAVVVAAALDAAYSDITVTDNTDGTITLNTNGHRMTATDTVAHASFTIAASTLLAATAGSGSMFVPALRVVLIDGLRGQTLSVIRASADGTATLTPVRTL